MSKNKLDSNFENTGMDYGRYIQLMCNQNIKLTEEEKENWHFCYDWNGLLIHRNWEEYKSCNCGFKENL